MEPHQIHTSYTQNKKVKICYSKFQPNKIK